MFCKKEMAMTQSMTSVSNKHYNLVSVLYHALEGAQTASRYMQDAHDDPELAQFFQQVQQQDDQCAQQALKLLMSRTKS
jgi:hypothetical protein